MNCRQYKLELKNVERIINSYNLLECSSSPFLLSYTSGGQLTLFLPSTIPYPSPFYHYFTFTHNTHSSYHRSNLSSNTCVILPSNYIIQKHHTPIWDNLINYQCKQILTQCRPLMDTHFIRKFFSFPLHTCVSPLSSIFSSSYIIYL